jgi:hypothetical protein
METFCQLSDFLITRLSEWLKKPEYGFARPLCEEKGVCDLGQLAVMQLRICKDLGHDGLRRVMCGKVFEVCNSWTAEA